MEVVFDLSEPLVFKLFRRPDHQGSQGRGANTLDLRVNLRSEFFWEYIFAHNLQLGGGEKDKTFPIGAADTEWKTMLVIKCKGFLTKAELLQQSGNNSDNLTY